MASPPVRASGTGVPRALILVVRVVVGDAERVEDDPDQVPPHHDIDVPMDQFSSPGWLRLLGRSGVDTAAVRCRGQPLGLALPPANRHEAEMLSDLASFLTAILGSWITLMGGIVAVVLYILARYRGRDVRGWTYAGIALFALFVSCFLAWRDEHGRVERRAHLAEVKDCPRWLNDARKTQLIDALRAVEPPASVEVAWVGGSGEAERYAEDFLQVLDTVGWKATTTQVATMAPVPSLGLDVRARPRDVPAGELVSTLDRLGVPVELISDPTRAEHEVKIRVGKKPE